MTTTIDALYKKHCESERWLKVKDVSKILNMDIYTVYRKAKLGQIPSHKFGRSYRFKLSEINSI